MTLKRLYVVIAVFVYLMLSTLVGPSLNLSAAEEFGSLYQAIESANRSGSGSITLTADIVLGDRLPPITGEIEIKGNGHSISGANAYRIFVVDGGDLTVRNLTLTEGSSPEDGGAIFLQNGGELIIEDSTFASNWSEKGGGAISSSPSAVGLSVRNSIFNDNLSGSGGGAILAFGGRTEISGSIFQDNEAVHFGGGVEAFVGEVDIWNSTFAGNQAGQGGGILVSGAQTTLTHLTLVENKARGGEGDAIYVRDGQVYLRNSIVAGGGAGLDCSGRQLAESSANLSEDGTCAHLPSGDPMLAQMTGSPAYFPLQDGSPAVDAADSRYCLDVDQRGEARPQGGGCDIGAFESATVTAAEPPPAPTQCTLANHILSANTNTSVGGCPTGTSHDIITLTEDIVLSEALPPINGNITIEGNGHRISGDNRFRIFDVVGRKLTINNLTLARGLGEGNGGAIRMHNNAELVVNNSHFQSNRIEVIRRGNSGYHGNGGAIGTHNFNGAISVNNSVFSGNFAGTAGGAINVNGGGTVTIRGSAFTRNQAGIYGGALEISRGRLDIENSTFHRNSASLAGGIAVWGGTATMTHVTMLANRVSLDGKGNAIKQWGGSARLRNSIVAGGTNEPDCHGGMSGRGNYSQDGTCPGSVAHQNPRLANPLLSMTMAGMPGAFSPQARSPVVDAADAAFCLATDQAGTPRPQGAGCDIGAIEWTPNSQAQADSSGAQAGAPCRVTTTRGLDIRDAPRGQRIDAVQANTTLTATARTQDWFQVEKRGVLGWISAEYVRTAGVCG